MIKQIINAYHPPGQEIDIQIRKISCKLLEGKDDLRFFTGGISPCRGCGYEMACGVQNG